MLVGGGCLCNFNGENDDVGFILFKICLSLGPGMNDNMILNQSGSSCLNI